MSDANTSNTYKGMVIRGEKKGRTLGFPTANVKLSTDTPSQLEPGIYAGLVRRIGEMEKQDGQKKDAQKYDEYHAALYVRGDDVIEAFLFDFEGDLYGEQVIVSVGSKIRAPRAFGDDEDAKRQIAQDVKDVKIRPCSRES